MKKYKICSISRKKKTIYWYAQSSNTVLRVWLSHPIQSSSFSVCLVQYTILVFTEKSWKTEKKISVQLKIKIDSSHIQLGILAFD